MQQVMQQALQQKLIGLAKPDLIAKWLGVLLMVVSLWLLAKLIWLWVEAFSTDYQVPSFSSKQSRNSKSQVAQVSVTSIVDKHLFGDEMAKPVEVEQPKEVVTQETDLNLTLRGIYASDNEKKANAIIELAGGKQAVYFVGDKIEGARNTSLHQVQPIKVILNRSGRFESLTLEQKEAGVVLSQSDRPSVDISLPGENGAAGKSIVDNPRVKRELNAIREKLQTDPASLRDMMRWEPVMNNGELQGVRISPGKSRRLFYELKLRRNDVVTNINGMPLSDPSQLLSLQQEMATASEISLSVLRNGQPQDITIKLEEGK